MLFFEKQVNSSSAARKWYLGLRNKILSLERMPMRGEPVHEDRSLRQLLFGRKPHVYRIIYLVIEPQRVHVLHIRHGARRPLSGRRKL
jgi:plasmid stabilization system protein ParE